MFRSIQNEQTAAYLRLFRKWWWVPVVFALASGAIAYKATSHFQKTMYGSSLTLQVLNTGQSGPGGYSTDDASSDAVLLTSTPVLREAAAKPGPNVLRDPASLYSISCSADSTDRFIYCSSEAADYRAAAGALNHLVRTFTQFSLRQQDAQYEPNLQLIKQQEAGLRKEIAKLQARLAPLQALTSPTTDQQYQITSLESQVTQDESSLSPLTVQEANLKQELAQASANIRIVNPALPNPHPIGPHPMRNALLGVIIGLGIAAALILVLEFLDDRFRSVDEIQEVTGQRILGTIRRIPGNGRANSALAAAHAPRSAIAEAYRLTRTNIQFVSVDQPLTTLLVTSARDGEGKTTSATNIAITTALSGRKVLLVDADLRRSGVSGVFKDIKHPGLSTILSDPDVDAPPATTEVANLEFAPSGPAPLNPDELLGSPRMRAWLKEMGERYDLIVIDTPPVLSLAEARVLAALADGVALVIDPSISSRRQAREAQNALEVVGANVLGIVVNRTTFTESEPLYDYYTAEKAAPKKPGKAVGSS